MKKEKNKKYIILISVVLFLLIVVGVYFIITSKNKNSLTLEENKWLDSNKHNVVDIAILSDIPVLSYDGKGIVYDYIDYVQENRSLEFNIIPYKLDTDVNYDNKIDLKNSITDDDIVLLRDNLVLITLNNNYYNNFKDITNLKIGVFSSDRELIQNYLNDSISIVDYGSYTELIKAFSETKIDSDSEVEELKLDGMIVPKSIYTKEIIENNYIISYSFTDLNKYYVLSLGDSKEFASIMKKSFNIWKEDNYNVSYNNSLLDSYYNFKNVTDTDQKNLQSKKYVYGFIDYGIYNNLNSKKISGFNEILLKGFNSFSGLSIKYTKYTNINKLLKDYSTNKVDFVLNIINDESVENSYKTSTAYEKQLAIISEVSNTDTISSIYSLRGKDVLTIKDSYLEKYLMDNDIKVKSYNNLKDLTDDFSSNDIAVVDLENYNYYKTSAFKNTKIDCLLDIDDGYNFIIKDNEENEQFKNIFSFYINYVNIDELMNQNYSDIAYENINIVYILILIIIFLCIYVVLDFSNHVKVIVKKIKNNRKIHLSKEDKIKYIDQLTSLKNRAYLNSRIETWDASEIYPQAVIIVDLNNISYINDNYGREEGDKVITEAANILIQHQLQNSEIIRTDGNEFLIYLVGYDEKQIVSYLRRLTKEFKGLSHGFGAASGYSIILDAIKTFDDAVNEATLDMKNNKEDIDY